MGENFQLVRRKYSGKYSIDMEGNMVENNELAW